MQDGGINESESWAQAVPLDAENGRGMLFALEVRLPFRERMMRANAIAAARTYIARCEIAGGISAPVSRSFNVSGDRTRRVDIEVHSGIAFVLPPPPVAVPQGTVR
jgi:hypothetical protein